MDKDKSGKYRFSVYIEKKDPSDFAICNFLTLAKSQRTELIVEMLKHYLGPEGIRFYLECNDQDASDTYVNALLMYLRDDELSEGLLKAMGDISKKQTGKKA